MPSARVLRGEPLQALDPEHYRDLVRRALDEDLGAGDVTTDATVASGLRARGVFLVKADCVLAGLDVAIEAFRQLDPDVETRLQKHDGDRLRPGEEIAEIIGSARALLIGERTALNFLQRLSGIATLAREFVNAAGGRIIVLDTRKTTPRLATVSKWPEHRQFKKSRSGPVVCAPVAPLREGDLLDWLRPSPRHRRKSVGDVSERARPARGALESVRSGTLP